MVKYDYDLFTIGAGSGGVRASRMAASAGARVGVAEERYLGGTCVNVGCVPKKFFVYASQFSEAFEDAAGYGWNVGDTETDWPRFMESKNNEIQRLNGIYAKLLDNAGSERFEGHAHIIDEHTVAVGDQKFTTEYILVATGGWPRQPTIPGAEHAVTSNEVFGFETLPGRVIVVGGGYIGVEFAGIFNGLGVETTLLYYKDLFLRGFDDDVRTVLRDEMVKKGVNLRFQTNLDSIEKQADGLHAHLSDGTTLVADHIVYAIGREPLTADIGLENVGVKLDSRGAIAVDDYSQTSVPNIYAVGDVTNRVNLTPVAIAEGMALVKTLFQNEPTVPDYSNIPSAVFSQPPIGTVGLTEQAAREQHANVDIYRANFRAMKHTISGRDERTMMKLVVDGDSDRVLGVHMIGADAGEIVQGFAVALKAGATKAVFDSTVGIHPTSAEEFVTMREKVTSEKVTGKQVTS